MSSEQTMAITGSIDISRTVNTQLRIFFSIVALLFFNEVGLEIDPKDKLIRMNREAILSELTVGPDGDYNFFSEEIG